MKRKIISFKMTNENINHLIHISEQASGSVTLLRGARAVDGCSPIGVMTINVEQPFTIEFKIQQSQCEMLVSRRKAIPIFHNSDRKICKKK